MSADMIVAFDASAIGDPDSTRTVYAIVALLVVIGLALVMLAFWLRRSTRPDPEFLAPLEAMGERSWRKRDPVWQRRRLDEVRPEGAAPITRASLPPSIDASFDVAPSAAGFDDLRDDDRDLGHDDHTNALDTESDAGDDGTTAIAPPEVGKVAVAVDRDATADSPSEDTSAESLDGEDPAPAEPADTPIAAERPLDDFADPGLGADFDPDALARAMADLDAELQRGRNDS